MGEAVFKALIDTSIYIPFINRGMTHPVLKFRDRMPLLYMSTVVMEELYAGAFDKTSIRLLDRLFKTFDQLRRIVTPDSSGGQNHC
jgi:predicted nucleic acid-binding protein